MVLLMSTVSVAQPRPQNRGRDTPPPIEDRMKDLEESLTRAGLDLNDKESTGILSAYLSFFESVDELMEEGRPDRAKVEKLAASRDKLIQGKLDADSFAKYEANKETLIPRPQRRRD